MKYYTRLNRYKASNVEFDCNSLTAWSYGWWNFFRNINGLNVFNNYFYSVSTRGHQAKIRRLLHELNIPIDVEINTVKSLTVSDACLDAFNSLLVKQNQIKARYDQLKNKTGIRGFQLSNQYVKLGERINEIKQLV